MGGREASQSNFLFAGVFPGDLLALLLQAEVHPHTILLILQVEDAGWSNTMGHVSKMVASVKELTSHL